MAVSGGEVGGGGADAVGPGHAGPTPVLDEDHGAGRGQNAIISAKLEELQASCHVRDQTFEEIKVLLDEVASFAADFEPASWASTFPTNGHAYSAAQAEIGLVVRGLCSSIDTQIKQRKFGGCLAESLDLLRESAILDAHLAHEGRYEKACTTLNTAAADIYEQFLTLIGRHVHCEGSLKSMKLNGETAGRAQQIVRQLNCVATCQQFHARESIGFASEVASMLDATMEHMHVKMRTALALAGAAAHIDECGATAADACVTNDSTTCDSTTYDSQGKLAIPHCPDFEVAVQVLGWIDDLVNIRPDHTDTLNRSKGIQRLVVRKLSEIGDRASRALAAIDCGGIVSLDEHEIVRYSNVLKQQYGAVSDAMSHIAAAKEHLGSIETLWHEGGTNVELVLQNHGADLLVSLDRLRLEDLGRLVTGNVCASEPTNGDGCRTTSDSDAVARQLVVGLLKVEHMAKFNLLVGLTPPGARSMEIEFRLMFSRLSGRIEGVASTSTTLASIINDPNPITKQVHAFTIALRRVKELAAVSAAVDQTMTSLHTFGMWNELDTGEMRSRSPLHQIASNWMSLFVNLKLQEMITDFNDSASALVGGCDAALEANQFHVFDSCEKKLQECCVLDIALDEAGQVKVFDTAHNTVLAKLRVWTQGLEESGTTLIKGDRLDDALAVLGQLKDMQCLDRLVIGRRLISNVYQQLQNLHASKLKAFYSVVLKLFDQERFCKIVTMFEGARGQHQAMVTECQAFITAECERRFALIERTFATAVETIGTSVQHDTGEAGRFLAWFDRAEALAAVVKKGQFQSWRTELHNKAEHCMTSTSGTADRMLKRFAYTNAIDAVFELRKYRSPFPQKIQKVAIAMQDDFKATFESSLNECCAKLVASLETGKTETANTILEAVAAVEALRERADNGRVPAVAVDTAQLLAELNRIMLQNVTAKCDMIYSSLDALQFALALPAMDYMAQLRSHAPKWMSRHAHAHRFSQTALREYAESEMEAVLKVEWIADAKPTTQSSAHKKQVLLGCKTADSLLFAKLAKKLGASVISRLGCVLPVDSVEKMKLARTWAHQLAECMKLVPLDTSVLSKFCGAGVRLYENVKLQMVQTRGLYAEAKRGNNALALNSTREFLALAPALETFATLAPMATDERSAANTLIANILAEIAQDSILLAGLRKAWRTMEQLDLGADDLGFGGKNSEGTVAWAFHSIQAKKAYLATFADFQDFTMQSFAVVLESKKQGVPHLLEHYWKEQSIDRIVNMRNNVGRICQSFKSHQTTNPGQIERLDAMSLIDSFIKARAKELESAAIDCFGSTLNGCEFSPQTARDQMKPFNAQVAQYMALSTPLKVRTPWAQAVELKTHDAVLAVTVINGARAYAEKCVSGIMAMRMTPENVCAHLLKLYAAPSHIELLAAAVAVKGAINSCIDDILHASHALSQGNVARQGFMADLERGLQANNLGSEIVAKPQFKFFRRFRLEEFKKRVLVKGFETALTHVAADKLNSRIGEIQQDRLNRLHTLYKGEYTRLVDDHKKELNQDHRCKSLADEMLSLFKSEDRVKMPRHDQLALLVAGVFALWSLMEVHTPDSTRGSADVEHQEPYGLQIMALFFLFGFDDEDQAEPAKLDSSFVELQKNHFIEILTGQGKSITLGVLSATLAIIGCDVDCVCFSKYLSERDHESFKRVFSLCGVAEAITYGTFKDMSNKLLTRDSKVDVRKCAKQLLSSETIVIAPSGRTSCHRPRVALFDEADVLFSSKYYGQTYRPSCTFDTDAVQELVKLAWQYRTSTGTGAAYKVTGVQLNAADEILKSTEFENVVAAAPHCEANFKNLVEELVRDLRSLPSHKYNVCGGGETKKQVCYPDGAGGTTTATSYGSSTLWARFQEHEKDNTFDRSISCNVAAGQYSYAEMPLQYDVIFGVTGTLKSLPEPMLTKLERDFEVEKFTYTPSIFGPRLLEPWESNSNIFVENEQWDQYAVAIGIIEKKVTNGQPVIIFLDSDKAVESFWDFLQSKTSWSQTGQMRKVVATTVDVQSEVENATRLNEHGQGHITLFSRDLGRGTDFIVSAPSIDKAGGLCIIQLFFSDDLSEQIQIEGRTARAGKRGEYYLILDKTSLGATEEEIRACGQSKTACIYTMLCEKRASKSTESCKDLNLRVGAAKSKHDDTIRFKEELENAAAGKAVLAECAGLLALF
jgi:hypothetical protein